MRNSKADPAVIRQRAHDRLKRANSRADVPKGFRPNQSYEAAKIVTDMIRTDGKYNRSAARIVLGAAGLPPIV